jgi:hypothetical protein
VLLSAAQYDVDTAHGATQSVRAARTAGCALNRFKSITGLLAPLIARLRTLRREPSGTTLRDGETRLAIVRQGSVIAQTADITLSHAEFVRRTCGTLPEGAWVGTIRKVGRQVLALNSRTFYGNQLPAPQHVLDTVRGTFR